MSLRDSSKQNWAGGSTLEQINAGSLQRIADASEIMASNFVSLQNDRDWYKKRHEEEKTRRQRLEHSNAALRGHIKHIKQRNQLPKELKS